MFKQSLHLKNLSHTAWASYFMFTIVFNDIRSVGKLPNRRNHGLLSQIGLELSPTVYVVWKKTLLYSVRRALSLHALLTIYIYYNKEKFCQTYEISKEWGCLIAAVAASPQHPLSITREGGNL